MGFEVEDGVDVDVDVDGSGSVTRERSSDRRGVRFSVGGEGRRGCGGRAFLEDLEVEESSACIRLFAWERAVGGGGGSISVKRELVSVVLGT